MNVGLDTSSGERAETASEAADERGLARPEVPVQQHHVARANARSELLAGG